jgi:chromosome segregation protein
VGTRSVRCRGSPAAANVWQSNARRCRFPTTVELPTSRRSLPTCASAIAEALQIQQGQQDELPSLEQQRRTILAEVQHAQKERAEAQARRMALQQLQQRLQANGKLDDWLRRHGLQHGEPLWKALQVEAGWEDAVEAVLRERLAALPADCRRPGVEQGSAGRQIDLAAAAGWRKTAGAACRRNCCWREFVATMRQLTAILADWLGEVHSAPIWRLHWRAATACRRAPVA